MKIQKLLGKNISTKIMVYFLIVSMVPLVVSSALLVSSARTQLLIAASTNQQALASNLSDNVSNYLSNNKITLNGIAKVYSADSGKLGEIGKNIAVLFSQYSDLNRLAILDGSGQEVTAYDRNGISSKLVDASETDAFKAVNFLNGKDYISSVNYDSNNKPSITIAAPVITSDYGSRLDSISEANFGAYNGPDDIIGAVIASYDIEDLWQSILSTEVGDSGYAYVVDGLGNLVAHPNPELFEENNKLGEVEAAKQFIDGDIETRETISEAGEVVISTPKIIPQSGWAVIVQEPVQSIYASIDSYLQLAAIVAGVAVVLSILVSLFFRRKLTVPIKKLTQGANLIGSGDFDHKIEINSEDELQSLGETLNNMGSGIKKLVSELKMNNVVVNVEKSKLANIISSVTDGIIAVDVNGHILSINPPAAILANAPIDNLLGKKIEDVFGWEQNEGKLTVEVIKPGSYEYTEVMLHHGEEVAFLDLIVSVIDKNESDVSAIVTIHDLTKSRELDFMKLDFVAIAAHELRTPLTVVQGYMDILNSEGKNQLSIFNLENLQKMIQSTNELRDLINKLLNIARIERGEMEIFLEKLDITRHIEENVHQHEPSAVRNEQELTYTTSETRHVYVPADSSSITEVLNNLIGNAIKFTGPNGKISVKMTVDNDKVRVEVSDNGPGVPDELHDKLFTKFYRAERSLISGTRGTGLGLFISRTIIKLQGGEIGILPSGEKGSTFYFTLPIYNDEIHDKLISKHKKAGGIHGWFKKNTSS